MYDLAFIKTDIPTPSLPTSPLTSPSHVFQKSSERHPQDTLGLCGGGGGGGNVSSTEGRGPRDGSVESEKWSRKRGHERESRWVCVEDWRTHIYIHTHLLLLFKEDTKDC